MISVKWWLKGKKTVFGEFTEQTLFGSYMQRKLKKSMQDGEKNKNAKELKKKKVSNTKVVSVRLNPSDFDKISALSPSYVKGVSGGVAEWIRKVVQSRVEEIKKSESEDDVALYGGLSNHVSKNMMQSRDRDDAKKLINILFPEQVNSPNS